MLHCVVCQEPRDMCLNSVITFDRPTNTARSVHLFISPERNFDSSPVTLRLNWMDVKRRADNLPYRFQFAAVLSLQSRRPLVHLNGFPC